MLSSYHRTSDVMEMVGVPNWGHVTGRFLLGICRIVTHSIYCGNLGTRSVMREYGHSLIIRPDLFCDGRYLVTPTFETSVQRVFKCFLWFFKPPYNAFHLFPG